MNPPPDLIFRIAEDAGIKLKGNGDKRQCRCPLHDDRNASAYFVGSTNCFGCSVCTPGRALSAKLFCEKLGLDWRRYAASWSSSPVQDRAPEEKPTFTASDAEHAWKVSYARSRDDGSVEADREPYNFLIARGLMEASEYGVYGILPDGVSLPGDVATWRRRGYGLVVPLFDQSGNVACIQSRSVRGGEPRTLFPTGSHAGGTVFADERGLAILRGTAPTAGPVIYGEGLTDFLALTIASPVAVLGAPGTSMAVAGVGAWAARRRVLVALDCDTAGNGVVSDVRDALYDAGASSVARVSWPRGAKDACDVVAARGTTGLNEFLHRQIGGSAA
jgi:hypothetical protein